MRRIAFVLLGILVLGAAHARESPSAAPEDQTCIEGEFNVAIKTRYGWVSYGGEDYFKVDGKGVPTQSLNTGDAIAFKKLFQLGDEDVLLSAGIYLGNTDPPHYQDFLLVLGPGKPPHIILIPGDTACPMWQDGNALYTGGTKDQCGNKLPVIKFEHDKFVGDDKPKPTCVRKPYVMNKESCREEFELAEKLCSSIPREKCGSDANSENAGYYGPLSELGAFNSAARELYFNKPEFDKICASWCSGTQISYKTYRKSLCMAR